MRKQSRLRSLDVNTDERTRVAAQGERFAAERPTAEARVAKIAERRNGKLLAAEGGDGAAQKAVAELTRELRAAEQRVADLDELTRQTGRRLEELELERRELIKLDVKADVTALVQNELLPHATSADEHLAALVTELRAIKGTLDKMSECLNEVRSFSEQEAEDVYPSSNAQIIMKNFKTRLHFILADFVERPQVLDHQRRLNSFEDTIRKINHDLLPPGEGRAA
jgi:chromosome segregation ATPase